MYGPEIAADYDRSHAELFRAEAVDPAVDVLAELAGAGPALELAVGTGRIALPLSRRGVPVHGIELSTHMVEQLRRKRGAEAVGVTVGDMTTTRVAGEFTVVYLVFNTIMNVLTQDGQLAVFRNAAAHLAPGGAFVVEVMVPAPTGDGSPRVFAMEDGHVGIDTYDDPVNQILRSHHWEDVGGRFEHNADAFRYVWPSELDLMAQLAALQLRDRWASWDKDPFTASSPSQVAVWAKAA